MKKCFVLCCFLVGLALSSSFSQSTVFIVRHAEKADKAKTRNYPKPVAPAPKPWLTC
jgi:hypothetical protein